MKKKFIAVYALIGVLALGSTTLTSCVDDNESASVTAVRDAKAAQLNAMAEAETALANLRNAKAAVEEAKAANEAAELPALQAEAEKRVAEAQEAMQTALNNITKDAQQYVQDLALAYSNAQDEVITLTGDIIDQELLLAKYNADLVNAQTLARQTILSLERSIASDSAKIEAYKALDGTSVEELRNQVNELQAEQAIKSATQSTLSTTTTNAITAFNNAANPLQAVTTPGVSDDDWLDAVKAIDELSGTWVGGVQLLDQETKYSDAEEQISTATITVYSLNQSAATVYRQNLRNAVTTATNELGKSTDAAVTSDPYFSTAGVSATATAYAHYNFYNEAKKTADAALAAYTGTDATIRQNLQDAVDNAALDLSQAQKIYLDAYQDNIDAATEALADYDTAVANLDANSDAYKEYLAAVDAVIANEGKAVVDATEAEDAASLELAILTGELTAANNLLSSSIDVETELTQLDVNIAGYKQQIAQAEQMLSGANGAQAIYDMAEATLEAMKEELTLKESIAAQCKSDLEAAINGSTPAPETPAEGEETPAA